MWYNFDVHKFGWQMLPPILRSRFLFAMVRVLLTPLVYVYEHFRELTKKVDVIFEGNGQAISIAKALNDKYLLQYDEIYITDVPEQLVPLYKRGERQKTTVFRLRREKEKTPTVVFRGEGRACDFIVNIPSSLREYEAEMIRLINFYKPAGRNYIINYYDNE